MRKTWWMCLLIVLTMSCGDEREPRAPYAGSPAGDASFTPANGGGSTTDPADMGADADVAGPPVCDQETPCELTCEVLLDPGFCWNVGVAEAYACMADASTGVMSTDGLRCGDDDWMATFASAIDMDVIDRDLWDFELTRGAESCAQFQDTGDDMTLATESSITMVSVDIDLELYTITCADGSSWQSEDALSLGSCLNSDGNSNIPGRGVTSIGAEWGFQLLPEPTSLFSCVFE